MAKHEFDWDKRNEVIGRAFPVINEVISNEIETTRSGRGVIGEYFISVSLNTRHGRVSVEAIYDEDNYEIPSPHKVDVAVEHARLAGQAEVGEEYIFETARLEGTKISGRRLGIDQDQPREIYYQIGPRNYRFMTTKS